MYTNDSARCPIFSTPIIQANTEIIANRDRSLSKIPQVLLIRFQCQGPLPRPTAKATYASSPQPPPTPSPSLIPQLVPSPGFPHQQFIKLMFHKNNSPFFKRNHKDWSLSEYLSFRHRPRFSPRQILDGWKKSLRNISTCASSSCCTNAQRLKATELLTRYEELVSTSHEPLIKLMRQMASGPICSPLPYTSAGDADDLLAHPMFACNTGPNGPQNDLLAHLFGPLGVMNRANIFILGKRIRPTSRQVLVRTENTRDTPGSISYTLWAGISGASSERTIHADE